MSKPHRIHQTFGSSEWKYGHPSSTWSRRMGLKRNKGRRDFSAAFQEEFKDVLDSQEEPLGKRWTAHKGNNKAPYIEPLPHDVKALVDETLRKYELHPDFDFLHRMGLAAASTAYLYDSQNSLDGHFRDFIDYCLYHAIRAGHKPIALDNLFHRFMGVPGQNATDRIVQEKEAEYKLFGVDGQNSDVDKGVQKFKAYIEYLADRYAFSGTDITKLIEAGVQGTKKAITKFGLDGDSPEYRGLVLSHINWYMQQAANLSPEQRMKTPTMQELLQGYEEKEAYELKLREEGEERRISVNTKRATFGKFIRKFLTKEEYKSLGEKIVQARERVDENSDPLVVALNVLTENVPRYKGKNVWDFQFRGHYPEEVKKATLEKLRYILEVERSIPIDQISSTVNTYLIDDLGFRNFRCGAYKGRTIDLLNDLYPGRFKPWEFRTGKGGPRGGRNSIWARGGVELFDEATRWLVEEKLKIPVDEAPQKLTLDVYEQYGLGNALKRFFDGSPMHALAAAYPNKLDPEDFVKVLEKRQQFPVDNDLLAEIIESYEKYMWRFASRYFRGLTRDSQPLLRHLIDIDDLVQEGRRAIWEAMRNNEITPENAASYRPLITRYIQNNIKGAVHNVYSKNDVLSLSDSLDSLVYTHGQRKSEKTLGEIVGSEDEDTATGETIKGRTTDYLYPLQESLGKKNKRFLGLLEGTLSKEEYRSMSSAIHERLTQLENRYIWNRADFDPVDEAMQILQTVPRFKAIQKWELKGHPWKGSIRARDGETATYFSRLKGAELARVATRWLYEAKLGVPINRIPEVCKTRIFQDNGLGGMLIEIYDGSAWAATEDAYPSRWKPWEFTYPPHLWERDDAYEISRAAVRWLVEDKLKTTPDRVTRTDFHEHGLDGMLVQLKMGFRGAIRNAYPEIYDPRKIEQLRSFIRQNLPQGLYALLPEKIVLNSVPAKEGWEPVDVGIQVMARIDPDYGKRPIWQFRYNNELGKRYSRPLFERGIKELVEREGIPVEDIPLRVTKETIESYGMKDAVNELFGGSIFSAIDNAYPSQFNPSDFNGHDPRYFAGYLSMLGPNRRILIPYNGTTPTLVEKRVQMTAESIGKNIVTESSKAGLYVSLAG